MLAHYVLSYDILLESQCNGNFDHLSTNTIVVKIGKRCFDWLKYVFILYGLSDSLSYESMLVPK